MQSVFRAIFLFSLLALATSASRADPYADALYSFQRAGESGAYFETAYGYALFPTIGKGGFIVGAAYGTGRVFAQGQHVGDSTVTQLSAGLLAGGQAFSQIIFFENQQSFKDFTAGNFEFSAQATGVIITAGASAEANTGGGMAAGASGGRNDATTAHAGYRKGMAVFTIAKGGLMGEISLGGQKFSFTPL
jgi:lipid-binding SYLF domain-containing protein